MTDRLDPRFDPQLAALERRLERASQPTVPTDLRRRVLSAVDAVLDETAPATVPGWPEESIPAVRDGLVFVVSAIAAVIALVAFSGAAVSNSALPLSLDARARMAGVCGETLAMPGAGRRTTDVALQQSSAVDASARPAVLRPLDTPRILQETL